MRYRAKFPGYVPVFSRPVELLLLLRLERAIPVPDR